MSVDVDFAMSRYVCVANLLEIVVLDLTYNIQLCIVNFSVVLVALTRCPTMSGEAFSAPSSKQRSDGFPSHARRKSIRRGCVLAS
jgi:hypothetical protein